jgi:hypothetical protein
MEISVGMLICRLRYTGYYLSCCETRSLILRKERWLGVFENRALRRIFGPKRDQVTGEWRKLHN